MKLLYEKNGLIYAECEACHRILKFREYQIPDIEDGVECFCGEISDEIVGYKNKTAITPTTSAAVIPTNPSTPSTAVITSPTSSLTNIQNNQVQQKTIIEKTVYVEKKPSYSGPVCPTCGSRNVQKISLGSKLVGGWAFGYLSSNVRNTMKCNKCGYKW